MEVTIDVLFTWISHCWPAKIFHWLFDIKIFDTDPRHWTRDTDIEPEAAISTTDCCNQCNVKINKETREIIIKQVIIKQELKSFSQVLDYKTN